MWRTRAISSGTMNRLGFLPGGQFPVAGARQAGRIGGICGRASPCRTLQLAASSLPSELGARCATDSGSPTTKVKFLLQRKCMFEEHFGVTGAHSMLGNWDPNAAVPLEWSNGHVWTAELEVPHGEVYEYKLVLKNSNGGVQWQPGPNRVFSTLDRPSSLVISDSWEPQNELDEFQTDLEKRTPPPGFLQDDELREERDFRPQSFAVPHSMEFPAQGDELSESTDFRPQSFAAVAQEPAAAREDPEKIVAQFLQVMRNAEGLLDELQNTIQEKAGSIEELRSLFRNEHEKGSQ